MVRHPARTIRPALFAVLLLFSPALLAAQNLPAPVAQWYSALRMGDAAQFEQLMTAGATVEMKQAGIVRSRIEFIESLPDWVQIASEGELLVRPVSVSEQSAVTEVCYRFPGAELMNRETFKLEGGKIASVIQEEAGAACPGF